MSNENIARMPSLCTGKPGPSWNKPCTSSVHLIKLPERVSVSMTARKESDADEHVFEYHFIFERAAKVGESEDGDAYAQEENYLSTGRGAQCSDSHKTFVRHLE